MAAMATMLRICLSLLALQLFFFADLHFTVAASEISPTPSPESGIGSPSPSISLPPSPAPALAPSSEFHSPPAPSPDLAPTSSPAPTPESPSPTPSPSDASDISHDAKAEDSTAEPSSGGGLKGGQKAGVVIGVIFSACIVGVGGVIYKKRQENIRRSQYGYAVRRDLL